VDTDTQHSSVTVGCPNNTSAICNTPYNLHPRHTGRAHAKFTVSNRHCAPRTIHFQVNGQTIEDVDFGFRATHDGYNARNGELTQSINLEDVKVNDTIGLLAEVRPGGVPLIPCVSSLGAEICR
jgi:hypothetical protein